MPNKVQTIYNPQLIGADAQHRDIFHGDSAGNSLARMAPGTLVLPTSQNALVDWLKALSVCDMMERLGIPGTVTILHSYLSGVPWVMNPMTFEQYAQFGFNLVQDGGNVVSLPPELDWIVHFADPGHPDYVSPMALASSLAEGLPGSDGSEFVPVIEQLGSAGRLPFLFQPNVLFDYASVASAPRNPSGLNLAMGPAAFCAQDVNMAGFSSQLPTPFALSEVELSTGLVHTKGSSFNRSLGYIYNTHLPSGKVSGSSDLDPTRVHPVSEFEGITNPAAEAYTSYVERMLMGDDTELPDWFQKTTGSVFTNVTLALAPTGNPMSLYWTVKEHSLCNVTFARRTTVPINGVPLPFVFPDSIYLDRPDTSVRPLTREGYLYFREFEARGGSHPYVVLAGNYATGAIGSVTFPHEISLAGSPPCVTISDTVSTDRGFRLEIPTLINTMSSVTYKDLVPVSTGGPTYPRAISKFRFFNCRSVDQFMGKSNTTVTNLDEVDNASKTFGMCSVFDNEADSIQVLGVSTTSNQPSDSSGWNSGINVEFDGSSLKQEIGTYVEYYSWTDLSVDDDAIHRWNGAHVPTTNSLWYADRTNPLSNSMTIMVVKESGGALHVLEGEFPLALGDGVFVSELHSALVSNNPDTFLPLGQGFLTVPILVHMSPIGGLIIYEEEVVGD